MCVESWTAAAIADPLTVCCGRGTRRLSLHLALRIEALEDEAAVIAEQFLHPDRSKKDDGIVIIPLNTLALAPWALHHDPFYNDVPC